MDRCEITRVNALFDLLGWYVWHCPIIMSPGPIRALSVLTAKGDRHTIVVAIIAIRCLIIHPAR
jgi:hypothetical protein